jgi:tetratricopeptide (TPR) repeat protein
MRHAALAVLVPLILAAADNKLADNKLKDLCVPPPGAVAPSLPARLLEGQGRIHFPITTSSAQAQEFFDQGVAQMHSFWSMEAERSFLQAAALDPQAPMPQWGIAMAAAGDYRPRFQLESYPMRKPSSKRSGEGIPGGGLGRAITAAKKAVELGNVPGKATPLEKLYIAAVAARRDAAVKDRDAAYIEGLRAVLAAYPNEVEAKTYLALHLMRGFTTPDRQPREGSMEAVKLLRELLTVAPEHAGVHHYIIHGFEGSTFAKDAWPSCRRYPELASNIPHALHMPGHIWAQTGKWQEAAHSFESAADQEVANMRADQLYSKMHHGHNVHFLVTTYDFQGRYEDAEKAARGLLALEETPRERASGDNPYTPFRQGWFGLMRTLVRFEKWDEILDGKTLPLYDKPREQAWRHWAVGLAQAAKGNVKAAKSESRAMETARVKGKAHDDVPDALRTGRKELDGHIAWAEGKKTRALQLLEEAVRIERSLRYSEPPSYPRPVSEVLGRLALSAGKLEAAEAAFREALDQFPDSPRASSGLTETLQRLGKSQGFGF